MNFSSTTIWSVYCQAIFKLFEFWRWMQHGLVPIVPEKLRFFGFRPAYRLYTDIKESRNDHAIIVERSLIGAIRCVRDPTTISDELPILVSLSSSSVFIDQIWLPANIKGSAIRNVIELRLDQISPIPTSSICYSIDERNDNSSSDGKRQSVEFAITSKTTIKKVKERYEKKGDVLAIGYGIGCSGDLRHTFVRYEAASRKSFESRIKKLGLIALAAITFIVGVFINQNRQISALQSSRSEVIGLAAEAEKRKSHLNAINMIYSKKATSPQKIITILNALPENSIVDQITADDGLVILHYYLPSAARFSYADNLITSRKKSEFPGYDYLTLKEKK